MSSTERGERLRAAMRSTVRAGALVAGTSALLAEPAGAATVNGVERVAFGPEIDALLAIAVFVGVTLLVLLRRRRGPEQS